MLWGELQTVMQSALGSYASTGLPVNSATALRTLEATFFLALGTCEEMDKREDLSVDPEGRRARIRTRPSPVQRPRALGRAPRGRAGSSPLGDDPGRYAREIQAPQVLLLPEQSTLRTMAIRDHRDREMPAYEHAAKASPIEAS